MIIPSVGETAMALLQDGHVQPSDAKAQEFAALLSNPAPAAESPDKTYLLARGLMGVSIEPEIDAKIAGLLTQGINKLVNIQ